MGRVSAMYTVDREKLVLMMVRRFLSNAELADKAGVSRNTISTMVHGREVSAVTLRKVADVLEVQMEELVQSIRVKGGIGND